MPTALITGARKGLGRALALEFAGRGWQTFAFSRRLEERREAGVYWLQGDVTDPESMERIRRVVSREALALDVLINNAGAGGRGSELGNVAPDEVTSQFFVHCVGRCAFARSSRFFLQRLLAPSS
ncbi:MAG TPA: SDR family NAD(P)-dependent oxidoreductase [Gammaproteobacteria bacterium]